jgi:hypothetical protein
MIPYYCLMTKWIGLGDSTVFSWVGCHTSPSSYPLVHEYGRRDPLAVEHMESWF